MGCYLLLARRGFVLLLPLRLSATAARMRSLKAASSTLSPSWMSMARLTFPSRLELNRPEGSFNPAPLANVILTTCLYVSPVETMPPWSQPGVPLHFHSSTISGSASCMSSRTFASVFPRQPPSSLIFSSINAEADSTGTALFIYSSRSGTYLVALSIFPNVCEGTLRQIPPQRQCGGRQRLNGRRHASLLQAGRNAGANNMVILGGLPYSSDFSPWVALVNSIPTLVYRLTGLSIANVGASSHSYDFKSRRCRVRCPPAWPAGGARRRMRAPRARRCPPQSPTPPGHRPPRGGR